MTDMSWEHGADARAALKAIVTDPDHGVAALSSTQMMSNLLKDLLPDAPREKGMLVAAVEAGMASSLREHVAQGMDPSTAIRLTASSLSATTPFTPDACNWVAGEFAIALGISEGSEGDPVGGKPPGSDPIGQQGVPIQAEPAPREGYAAGPVQVQGYPQSPERGFPQVPERGFPQAPVQGYPQAPVQGYPPPGQMFAQAPMQGYAPPPGQRVPQSPGQRYPRVPAGAQNNRLAIAALLCGVVQALLWVLIVPGIIAAALALVFGLISMKQIKRSGEAGHGMAVTGVVLGALGVAAGVVVIVLIIIGAAVTSNYN